MGVAYLISVLVGRFDHDRIRAERIACVFNVYNVRFGRTGLSALFVEIRVFGVRRAVGFRYSRLQRIAAD